MKHTGSLSVVWVDSMLNESLLLVSKVTSKNESRQTHTDLINTYAKTVK